MAYIETSKGRVQNQVQAYITKTEESLKKMRNKAPGERISKDTSKGYIRDYIQANKQQLKNVVIRVAYITDEGMVNLMRNVHVTDDLTEAQMEELLGDPVTNVDMPSGEYNNKLEKKTIYGVSIAIIKAKVATPNRRQGQRRRRFNFAFEN